MKQILIVIIIAIVIGLGWYGYYLAQSPTVPVTNEVATTTPSIAVKDVDYYQGVIGHYAAPVAPGSYPGVVMIHEWWGLNDNIKNTAEKLAAEGYRVLAVDLFNQVATTSEAARAQVAALDQKEALKNLQAAVTFLDQEGATRVASLGWCFGGGQSLQLALSGTPLDATVIYYGNLATSTKQLSAIKWPVLGIFGETDATISTTTVSQFEKALNELEVKNEVHIYPGVGHAFANPSGDNYAAAETADAWTKTLNFLAKNLKQ